MVMLKNTVSISAIRNLKNFNEKFAGFIGFIGLGELDWGTGGFAQYNNDAYAFDINIKDSKYYIRFVCRDGKNWASIRSKSRNLEVSIDDELPEREKNLVLFNLDLFTLKDC